MADIKTKPNGIHYLEVRVPGPDGALKRQRISCDTRDMDEAKQQKGLWLAGLHPQHPAQGGVVAPKRRGHVGNSSTGQIVRQTEGGLTVEQLMTRCLTERKVWGACRAKRTHESNVRIIARMLPTKLPLAELSTQHVKDLSAAMAEAGYADASQRKLLGSLSAACRFAEDEGLILSRPRFPSIRVENVQDRVVSLDEEDAMLACIDARIDAEPLRAWWAFKQLVVLLLDTGFRLGEGLQCGPSSVKRKRWLDHRGRASEGTWLGLQRGTTKNMKPRDVPCTQRVLQLLPKLNERAAGGRWFPWPLGSSGPLYLLQCIRQDMAAKGFAFEDVKLHTFRHTCATRLAEGGMDLVSLRDWLGHSDIKITAARYVHLMNGHIYRGAAILDVYGPGHSIGADAGNEDEEETNHSTGNTLSNGRDRGEPVTMGVC
jgi:integrase